MPNVLYYAVDISTDIDLSIYIYLQIFSTLLLSVQLWLEGIQDSPGFQVCDAPVPTCPERLRVSLHVSDSAPPWWSPRHDPLPLSSSVSPSRPIWQLHIGRTVVQRQGCLETGALPDLHLRQRPRAVRRRDLRGHV